jgi:hypothetical protein
MSVSYRRRLKINKIKKNLPRLKWLNMKNAILKNSKPPKSRNFNKLKKNNIKKPQLKNYKSRL